MGFVSCCFSLLLIYGFCFMPFSLPSIYGFCFMPFFPSLYTWLLFHAVFPCCHIWLLFYAVFPFHLYLAFVSCRFSLTFTFLLIFSSYLNMQEICVWKQAVNQFFNQSIRQSSINMTINQS